MISHKACMLTQEGSSYTETLDSQDDMPVEKASMAMKGTEAMNN
jgi:hypothetical protein